MKSDKKQLFFEFEGGDDLTDKLAETLQEPEENADHFVKADATAPAEKKKLTLPETVMTFISCIVGIGVVSVPFGFGSAGYTHGLFINLFILCVMMISTHLYLTAMKLLGLSSLSDLCYMSMGKRSIYIVNGFMSFIFFFILVIYNI